MREYFYEVTESTDEILDVELYDIKECDCPETLKDWFFAARDISDSIVAQIEADKVSELLGDDWRKRATGMLIAMKKKMKAIERHCAANGFELPDSKDASRRAHIAQLEQQVAEAKAQERVVITDWLRAEFAERGAEIAEAITDRKHYAWSRNMRLIEGGKR